MIIAAVVAGIATLCAALAIAFSIRSRGESESIQSGDMDLGDFAKSAVVRGSTVDVARSRERSRRRRLWKLFIWLAPISIYFYYRIGTSNPIHLGFPHMSPSQAAIFMPLGLIALLGVVIIVPMMSAGKSPHVRY